MKYKYNPGDLVWVRISNAGECPGVIQGPFSLPFPFVTLCGKSAYHVELISSVYSFGQFCTCMLRPRRDDPQQLEGLGSRDQLTHPLADDPLPVPSQPVEV